MEITAASNPFKIFETWLAEAKTHPGIKEATAMAFATVGATGDLHNRIVLLKDFSDQGFTFFTNYASLKGQDLKSHPKAAAVFYWDPMFRQVKISGRVEKVERSISEAYWASRPRESQISQFISKQSQPVDSRETLDNEWAKAEVEFRGREIPCPADWGGYLIVPQLIEFWIGRAGRLHDRLVFEKHNSAWTFRRLYP